MRSTKKGWIVCMKRKVLNISPVMRIRKKELGKTEEVTEENYKNEKSEFGLVRLTECKIRVCVEKMITLSSVDRLRVVVEEEKLVLQKMR